MDETGPKRASITLRLRRRFQAPRETVFTAWTKPEALKQWWCPQGWTPAEIEVDLRVGGAYRIGMRRTNGGPPVYACGKFLEVQPPSKLVYTWQWDGAFEYLPEMRVTVQFLDVSGATELILTHENFPDLQVRQQHRHGWIVACDRLERTL